MISPEPSQPQSASNRMTNALNAMRATASNSAAAQQMENAANAAGFSPADSLCPSLTFQQRLWGCIYCAGVGIALTVLGFLLLWTGHIAGFAVTYTLGNLVSIGSSCFLFGPKRQCKSMFAAKRALATSIYLCAMIVTLIVAFKHGPFPIIIILIVTQWCALIWYLASYIPFGQKIIKKFVGGITNF